MRPRPTSTLFPYTTLFRSSESETGAGGRRCDGTQNVRGGAAANSSEHERLGGKSGVSKYAQRSVRQDRKSTRLNSSHSSISYAVFCLKKKTSPAASSSGPE